MSEHGEFLIHDNPQIGFIDQVLGTHRLEPEHVRPYFSEALDVASSVCTESIEKYLRGCLEYTRALSKPVPYKTSDGETVSIALGITAGPTSLFDATVVEQVEMGLVLSENRFASLATLRVDSMNIPSNGVSAPRINHPEDVDSFMRGLRYISSQL